MNPEKKVLRHPKFRTRSTDSYLVGNKAADEDTTSSPPSLQAPLSLTMGPNVVFGNAIGDPNCIALVEGWRPTFKVTYVSRKEYDSWR